MTKPNNTYPTPPLADFKKWYSIIETVNTQSQYDASGTIYPTYPRTDRSTTTYERDSSGSCTSSNVFTSDGFQFSGSYPITGTTYAGGSFEVTYDSTNGQTNAGFAGVNQDNYKGGKSEDETISDIESAITLKLSTIPWGGFSYSSGSSQSRTFSNVSSLYPEEKIILSISKKSYRFRFKIPSSHTGTFFKITYDIAEFPTDLLVPAFYVSEDNVIEWTGRGDPEDPEDASWLTDWVEMEPPDESGERRVVNIRYTCYRETKYGVKPQITGESFTPAAP